MVWEADEVDTWRKHFKSRKKTFFMKKNVIAFKGALGVLGFSQGCSENCSENYLFHMAV